MGFLGGRAPEPPEPPATLRAATASRARAKVKGLFGKGSSGYDRPGPSWNLPRGASQQALTGLGVLRAHKDPACQYLEWQY